MVFYIIIMVIIELNVSRMLIEHDLRKAWGPLRVIVCLLGGI